MLALVSFESTTLEPEPRSDELSIDRTLAWLVPLDGPDRTPIELRGGDELSIGRSRSSSIAIDDASVSRLHATIAWKGGDRVLVTDHESRRGTEVDGQKLTAPREVGHGAVIRVGPRRFIVLLPNVAEVRASSPRASAMERVRELVRRAAKSELPVLLVGETGVGKELLARAIHEGGSRSAGPFVAQNCGAITETLAESILFGHEKGAFTGALARATGVFEAASGGTLFLDKVGELPPAMQTRLLRVIEQREVTRVGATRPTPIDTRLVTATHRDLDAMVASGTFRADLLYRLDVIRVRVPPLRERLDELPELVEQLLSELDPSGTVRLDGGAERALTLHEWPGNVRELRNVIGRALTLRSGDLLRVDDLGLPAPDPRGSGPLRGAVSDTERAAILAALEATGGNRTHAAARLGIARRTLLYKLERLGITYPTAR
jgi:DNA-binding NtrC family response regulator